MVSFVVSFTLLAVCTLCFCSTNFHSPFASALSSILVYVGSFLMASKLSSNPSVIHRGHKYVLPYSLASRATPSQRQAPSSNLATPVVANTKEQHSSGLFIYNRSATTSRWGLLPGSQLFLWTLCARCNIWYIFSVVLV